MNARENEKLKVDEAVERDLDCFLGTALGAAIGDALGAPVEFYGNPDIITKRQINDFEYRCRPTDDTQMAEVILNSLVGEMGRTPGELPQTEPVMDNIAKGFAAWSRDPKGGHRAPGNECMAGCRELIQRLNTSMRAPGWWADAGREPGPRSGGGCGSVMRTYPFGLLAAGAPVSQSTEALSWAVQSSSMTHRHPIAHAACAAMVDAVAAAVALDVPQRGGGGTPDAVREIAGEAHEAAALFDDGTAKLIAQATTDAILWRHNQQGGRSPVDCLTEWDGWDARTAIAAGIYCFVLAWDNPKEALLLAANTPGDSDSIATITGALIGALHGASALPQEWREKVEWSESITRTTTALHALCCDIT